MVIFLPFLRDLEKLIIIEIFEEMFMTNDIDLKALSQEPSPPLASLAREVSAESCVMLKNECNVLPLGKENVISLFGRSQINYNKSGTGSGGLVRVKYTVNILEGIRNNSELSINEEVAHAYEQWILENPFDLGNGWAQEPWFQREMIPDDRLLSSARKKSDTAVIVIGRISGEDRDNSAEKGSWYLSEDEEKLLDAVTKYFDRTVVLLNVGNIIDMKWVEKYNIKSVMYIWQGGQEGGNAVADVLSGKVTPSGKLTDTIAKDIYLYPSVKNFGNSDFNLYVEDIFVGYRYFETFAPDDVLYPFGFGLSYTQFSFRTINTVLCDSTISLDIEIENTGSTKGRETVQAYFSAPFGLLGKSKRELCAFSKTRLLFPGEKQIIHMIINISDMCAYDDSGITGNKSCYVLEKGNYNIYIGNSVRCSDIAFTYTVDQTIVVKECTEAVAPMRSFDIFHAAEINGNPQLCYKPVSIRTVDYEKRLLEELPSELPYTGNLGIKLFDVKQGKHMMEEFVSQLSDTDLICLLKGEGMCSHKARPGNAGVLGGVTESLCSFGIPVAALHDGPSGIRMDSGEYATSIPNGTAIACTWDTSLAERLYELLSIEMSAYSVDCILGPGINIHRTPLNGRNFEYLSEDPYLSGIIGAALIRGISKHRNSATVKHFAANSQEFNRREVDSVMSERAAREIYLKSFEYAIKYGKPSSLMTSYNPLNGIWTANNYELNTLILRNEWGYDGFVMTDWWPKLSIEETDYINLKNMVEAQNDIFMPAPDSLTFNDNLTQSLKNGTITRGQLQRNAINVLRYLCTSKALDRFIENGCKMKRSLYEMLDTLKTVVEILSFENDLEYKLTLNKTGNHLLCIEYTSAEPTISQIMLTIKTDGRFVSSLTLNGTESSLKTVYKDVPFDCTDVSFALSYPGNLIKVKRVEIKEQ